MLNYDTLYDLVLAVQRREIDPSTLYVTVDNDCAYAYVDDDHHDWEEVWRSDFSPAGILVELLVALGVPARRA